MLLRRLDIVAFLQRTVFSLSIFCFTCLICLGNIPRCLETSFFSDHLLMTEVALYFFSMVSLPFSTFSPRRWLTLGVLSLATLSSFLYGCIREGVDLHASLYMIRLIAFYFTSTILASLCFKVFKEPLSFFKYLCKGYGIALILGFFFFFFFPMSEGLWKMLSSGHVVFHGDPHVWRFVSVYFDPNYYAAIVGIPLLLSLYIYQKTKEKKYVAFHFLCVISALLTQSRSGLFTLFLLLIWILFSSYKWVFSKRLLTFFLVISLFIAAFSIGFPDAIAAFFKRAFFIREDPSALYRFETFSWGISVFKENPLFGIGYNFLYSRVKEEIGLNSLDSSLLSLLVQVGAIPFCLLSFWGIYHACFLKKASVIWRKKEREGSLFLSSFICYGILIVFFTSQFNQLLFYPFWALPFTVIALFLKSYISQENIKKRQPG